MALVLDGNGTMTVGNGDITGLVAGALPSTVIGTGAVLQVVSQFFTGAEISTSSASWAATGISLAITPTSSSSKILAHASFDGAGANSSGKTCEWTIFRGGSALIVASSGGILQYDNTATNFHASVNLHYMDSPATTSSTSYEIYFKTNGAGMRLARDWGGIMFTLMEIAV
jgi:hypothetical protein